MIELFITLVALHLIADYPLQPEAIALGMNRLLDKARFGVNWWYWMAAHAATHGFAVAVATGSVWLGVAECLAHFAIDSGKCAKKYGLHIDQMLHVLCKIVWVLI